MNNVGYPPGVPTPYFWQNRVWPSRFHGPIYTRPVFGFPKIARVQTNFTPGYDINANIPQQPPVATNMSGLGRLWNEGDGIFKPGGYGGGVFDGDISGLGSLASVRTKRSARGVRGVGDAAIDYPWKASSDKTRELQVATNVSLKKAGMCPIATDGKLGGATCGARNFLTAHAKDLLGQEMLFSNPPACGQHESELVRPKEASSGCGAGGGGIVLTPALSPQPLVESGMSSSTKRTIGFALGGLLALGAVALLRKKRG